MNPFSRKALFSYPWYDDWSVVNLEFASLKTWTDLVRSTTRPWYFVTHSPMSSHPIYFITNVLFSNFYHYSCPGSGCWESSQAGLILIIFAVSLENTEMRIDNTTARLPSGNFTVYRWKKWWIILKNPGLHYILENGQMNFDADRY